MASDRAIPTCAGRTLAVLKVSEHNVGPSPRVRGERRPVRVSNSIPSGPSPRVRGELIHRINLAGILNFTRSTLNFGTQLSTPSGQLP